MIQALYPPFRKWSETGTVWIYSDTHFGDVELAAGIPDRPSDDEHVKLINKHCGKKDTLLLLGDVGDIEYAKKLRGYKVLICGNHDIGHTAYEDVFDEVYSGPLWIAEKLLLSHEPIQMINCAVNIHGHDHSRKTVNDPYHVNVCSDAVGYQPLNLNQFIQRSGRLAKVPSIHRQTIDRATGKRRGKDNAIRFHS